MPQVQLTRNPFREYARKKRQIYRVRDFMIFSAKWFTLRELSDSLEIPEANISACMRHLRKEKFGSFTVSKRPRFHNATTWEYHLLPPEAKEKRLQMPLDFPSRVK